MLPLLTVLDTVGVWRTRIIIWMVLQRYQTIQMHHGGLAAQQLAEQCL
jgi:hypothetical protein